MQYSKAITVSPGDCHAAHNNQLFGDSERIKQKQT